MYWLYRNLRRQVIWESVTFRCSQKSVDVFLSMFLSIVHLERNLQVFRDCIFDQICQCILGGYQLHLQ
jgi:hypothetical protein